MKKLLYNKFELVNDFFVHKNDKISIDDMFYFAPFEYQNQDKCFQLQGFCKNKEIFDQAFNYIKNSKGSVSSKLIKCSKKFVNLPKSKRERLLVHICKFYGIVTKTPKTNQVNTKNNCRFIVLKSELKKNILPYEKKIIPPVPEPEEGFKFVPLEKTIYVPDEIKFEITDNISYCNYLEARKDIFSKVHCHNKIGAKNLKNRLKKLKKVEKINVSEIIKHDDLLYKIWLEYISSLSKTKNCTKLLKSLSFKEMKEVITFVNENKRNTENLVKLVSIQEKVSGLPKNIFRGSQHHSFIMEDQLKCVKGKVSPSKKFKPRQIILISDMLLVCQIKGDTFSYIIHFSMNDCMIDASSLVIRIVSVSTKSTISIMFNDETQRKLWQTELERLVTSQSQD